VSQTVHRVGSVSTQDHTAHARLCCVKKYMYSAVVKIVTGYVITIGTSLTGVVHKVLLFARKFRRNCILLFTSFEIIWLIYLFMFYLTAL
jgi:hypothetical protein